MILCERIVVKVNHLELFVIAHFTAPVKPKDRIEIDNIANAKNPDTFIFILNRASEYLYFKSN